jgi:hypothetical protein
MFGLLFSSFGYLVQKGQNLLWADPIQLARVSELIAEFWKGGALGLDCIFSRSLFCGTQGRLASRNQVSCFVSSIEFELSRWTVIGINLRIRLMCEWKFPMLADSTFGRLPWVRLWLVFLFAKYPRTRLRHSGQFIERNISLQIMSKLEKISYRCFLRRLIELGFKGGNILFL